MPFSFSNKEHSSGTVAVFAIETGSVTLTIVRAFKSKLAQIIFVRRRMIDTDGIKDSKDMLRKACEKIEEIFQDIIARKSFFLLSNARVLVLLGSAWNVSWSDRMSIKKEKPFRLTKSSLEQAISENFKASHEGMTITSTHVMHVSLNGYKISNPFGKLTPAVQCEVYIESSPSEALSAIANAVEKHLPHGQIRFSTIGFAATEAVIEGTGEQSFILILPEQDLTEIVIARDSRIIAAASMPFGGATIARALFGEASALKDSLLKTKRFIAGTLDSASEDIATKACEKIKLEFSKEFQNVLWTMNGSLVCPSQVFVGGKSSAAFFLHDWIAKENYASQAFTADCFKVSALGGKDIALGAFAQSKSIPFVSAVSAKAAKMLSNTFFVEESDVK